jgi:hypothetical protein
MSGTDVKLQQPSKTISGAVDGLVHYDTVDAVCISAKTITFRMFGSRRKLVFDFQIIEPAQYLGTHLEMFVHWDGKWKVIPRVTKLFRVASIAAVRPIRDVKMIQPSLFVGKVFRCRVVMSGRAPAAYSVIEMVLEKLTG